MDTHIFKRNIVIYSIGNRLFDFFMVQAKGCITLYLYNLISVIVFCVCIFAEHYDLVEINYLILEKIFV